MIVANCISLFQVRKDPRGHSFSTYAQRREGGQGKAYAMRTRGEGAYTWKYVRKTSLLHVFCDIFIGWKSLPYFVVHGIDFRYCLIKHLL